MLATGKQISHRFSLTNLVYTHTHSHTLDNTNRLLLVALDSVKQSSCQAMKSNLLLRFPNEFPFENAYPQIVIVFVLLIYSFLKQKRTFHIC